jgi:hypothetical protein
MGENNVKKLALYRYPNEAGEMIVSVEPKSLTSAQLYYLLIADEGYYLYNKKINSNRRSIITPAYLLNNWEELKQKEGNN